MKSTCEAGGNRHTWKRILGVAVLAATAIGTQPASAEPLVNEAIINAPAAEVWRMFTTKEGMESWMVAHAEIDLRLGGLIRTNYAREGVLGDDKTIVNQVISFEPERMLSMKVHQPPADFEFRDAVDGMWTVIYFQPLGAEMTNVRIVGLGFGEDAQSQKMREFFARGNAWTLEQLQKKYWPLCARCEREKALEENTRKAVEEAVSRDPAPEKK
jgi:uncharacterized protein YndB with AHSA1/START domain